MHTVIETSLFSKLWPYYWREEERGAFAAFLAEKPSVGDVIPGAEGLVGAVPDRASLAV